MTVWVAGEALVDVLPGPTPDLLTPVPGGGPANTALALARLGVPVEFVGGLSQDSFGTNMAKQFQRDGVGLRHAVFNNLPTCLAMVSLDEKGTASYHFHIRGTATFEFDFQKLPIAPKPDVLHIGTLITLVEPTATAHFEWAKALQVPVVFDPNIRPSVEPDRELYRSTVERWIDVATVIKVSDDDVKWLYPDQDPIVKAKSWISPSRPLVILTRGSEGLIGITENEVIEVPGISIDVIDTVGAGDTVGAVIVESLTKHSIKDLHGELLTEILNRAVKAAAITCSRAGAQPPFANEL